MFECVHLKIMTANTYIALTMYEALYRQLTHLICTKSNERGTILFF